MMKMKITIDERKAKVDSEYTIEEMYEKIDNIAKRANITKKGKDGFYIGNNNAQDYSNFGKIIIDLNDSEWFIPYIDEWLWYVDNTIEDIAEYYKKGVKNITKKN